MKRDANHRFPTAGEGRVVSAAIVAITLIVSGLAAPAFALEQRQIGSWVLKSAQAQIGFYCTVESKQDGRTLGYQLIKDGRIFFGFESPGWRWTPRSAHNAKLIVGEAEWAGTAVAPLAEVLVFPIKPDQALDPARAMEAGKFLTFEADGTTIAFDLSGFAEAAKAQRDCLAQGG